ncbi:MAG: hypothetical protein V3T22_07265 [Planctomycetota bacterium]
MSQNRPLLALASLLLLPSWQEPAEPAAAPTTGRSYLRLDEDAGGLELKLAVRTLRAERSGAPSTTVSLVSVMHVAEARYFDALAELLDGFDVVLFEQVGGRVALPDGAQAEPWSERSLWQATHRRLASMVASMQSHHDWTGEASADLDELIAEASSARAAARMRRAAVDAWGRELQLGAAEEEGELVAWAVSLGADGAVGGEGLDADLRLDTADLALAGAGEDGLQQAFADALGLVFQLQGIDYTGAQWRNSDMSVEELTALLDEGGDESGLLATLGGSSLIARFAGGLLKFVGSTREGRGMLKILGVEVLARADQLLSAPPPGFENLFEILIERRNRVVLDDLSAVLTDEPEVRSVAVLYGAGHMAALEAALVENLGLELVEERWFLAVDLRFEDTGLPTSMIRMLRSTLKKQLDSQLGAADGR